MAAKHFSPSVLVFLIFAVFSAALGTVTPPASKRPPLLGGWQQIVSVKNDSHVQEVGRYAVKEYNRREHKHLKFVQVVEGQQQVVAGMNYRLLIEAIKPDPVLIKIYQGVVWEKAWEKFINLTAFEPVLA